MFVTKIQRFCTGDGPGVRTTVFFQGCGMRCAWCHNPETWTLGPVPLFMSASCIGCGACVDVCPTGARRRDAEGRILLDRETCAACGRCAGICPALATEMSSTDMTADEIYRAVDRDRAFFGETGGVTLSGGEPLLQADLDVLMRRFVSGGISVAVETAGFALPERMAVCAGNADLVLYDWKDSCPERLKKMTGADISVIRDNLFLCDRLMRRRGHGRIRLRCILVKTVNLESAHAGTIADTVLRLGACEGVELIPYHAYSGSKSTHVGLPDNGHTEWIPTPEEVGEFADLLKEKGVRVLSHG